MKAAIIKNFGDKTELQVVSDYPVPAINDDQVLVAISATSVNPIDYKARQGLLSGRFQWQFPVVLGWDVAGEIIAIGKNVTDFSIGQRVFARPANDVTGRFGSYAEFMAVDTNQLAKIPDNLTDSEAAAVPLAGETALQMLRALQIGPGKKVLIQAGAGGVGIFAIQLAKLMGAQVATTVSGSNIALVQQLGADIAIDYHKHAIQDILSDYDAVLDTIGDIDGGMDILSSGGRLITISASLSPEQTQRAHNETKTIATGWLQPNGQDLQQLADYIANDQLKIIIDSQYPLTTSGIQAAHARIESHHARGKIIINL